MTLNILFDGWLNVPHSYAIVNCFQLIHLKLKYGDKINMYIREPKYCCEFWVKGASVYSVEHTQVLNSINVWNGENIDLIYSITYPYNIEPTTNNVPKCVFYTAEYSRLTNSHFEPPDLNHLIDNPTHLWFTSPSAWSSVGLRELGIPDTKNRVISHGVDPKVFYKTNASELRKFYKFDDSDIVLLHNSTSCATGKGTHLVLAMMHYIVNVARRTEYKLIIKGISDLYDIKTCIARNLGYLNIKQDEITHMFTNHITLITEAVSFERMNLIYNMCDLCVSPYLCEGFNLTPLEALVTGTCVVVPRTGSTKEYIEDIYANGGSAYIHYIGSHVIDVEQGKINEINIDDLIGVVLSFKKGEPDSEQMIEHIKQQYSWFKVADLLYEYFLECSR
jgi:glycosyltransferase involved in cell wall biosynthesis